MTGRDIEAMTDTRLWLAIDQYGQKELLEGAPRKALLRLHGRKHADRIYRDKLDGSSVQVGWAVAGHWYDVYSVEPMEKVI